LFGFAGLLFWQREEVSKMLGERLTYQDRRDFKGTLKLFAEAKQAEIKPLGILLDPSKPLVLSGNRERES